jgi:hypothetical protein
MRIPTTWPARLAAFALAGLALAACAEQRVAPGASDYRPLPFRSQVTVTGTDNPGPLRVATVDLGFALGRSPATVRQGAVVQAVLTATIAGHGEFRGHWERDGAAVDAVSVFITYGDRLEVRLGGAESLPTDATGSHEVRFVIEAPADAPQPDPVTYVVTSARG